VADQGLKEPWRNSKQHLDVLAAKEVRVVMRWYLRTPTVLMLWETGFLWAICWKILLPLLLDTPLKWRRL